MPRFTLHRQKSLPKSRPQDPQKSPQTELPARDAESAKDEVPEGLRADPRVTIIDEMPRLLLIECPEEAAVEWLARMPGWKLQQEHRAKTPDPRPKLKERSTD
jgi:hypothetical protein